jgi:hypothetical protein
MACEEYLVDVFRRCVDLQNNNNQDNTCATKNVNKKAKANSDIISLAMFRRAVKMTSRLESFDYSFLDKNWKEEEACDDDYEEENTENDNEERKIFSGDNMENYVEENCEKDNEARKELHSVNIMDNEKSDSLVSVPRFWTTLPTEQNLKVDDYIYDFVRHPQAFRDRLALNNRYGSIQTLFFLPLCYF